MQKNVENYLKDISKSSRSAENLAKSVGFFVLENGMVVLVCE